MGPPLKASPLRLRQAPAAHGRAHRGGPLRCPIVCGWARWMYWVFWNFLALVFIGIFLWEGPFKMRVVFS